MYLSPRSSRARRRLLSLFLASILVPCSGCLFGSSGGSSSSCGQEGFDASSGNTLGMSSAPGRGPASLELELARATQRVLYLGSGQGNPASPGAPATAPDLDALRSRRASLLLQGLQSDPSLALRAAVPPGVPPSTGACAERFATITGTLRPVAIDGARGAGVEYVLRDDAGQAHVIHFATGHAPGFRTGDRVQARGLLIPCSGEGATLQSLSPGERAAADSLVAQKGGARLLAQAGALPDSGLARTFGAQSTAVILVNFQDEALSSTAGDAQNIVFSEVGGYFLEASDEQTWLTGQVLGPYPIAESSQVCDASTISSLARAAAVNAGVDLSQFTHYIYLFPQNSCYWLGLATIGGLPSEAWINGSLTLHTVAHELGHNLGLYHSHALDCGLGASLGASCESLEYGDTADIMGNLVPGHYNSFQKERLGWLDLGVSPLIDTISQDGVYSVDPYEAPTANTKALKILKSIDATTGDSTYYYLEYRQPEGYDQILGFLLVPNNLTGGILVHTGTDSDPNSSFMINMNPSSGSWYEAALNVGQGFTDPSTEANFTLLSADSTQASVQVSLGNDHPACARNAPTVTISPSVGTWAPAGATLTYTVSVQNNDSDGCTASTFNLAATPPAGWSGTLGSASVSVTPGNLGAASLQLTSPAGAAPGAYSLQVSGSSAAAPFLGQSGLATPLVAAARGLTVVALSDQSLYSPGSPVEITVYAASNGEAAPGAGYTLGVSRPDGTEVRRTGVTGPDGTDQHVFELSSCAMSGSYQLTLSATLGSASASDARSFEVN